jgi:hypothetical protein
MLLCVYAYAYVCMSAYGDMFARKNTDVHVHIMNMDLESSLPLWAEEVEVSSAYILKGVHDTNTHM